jgi:hypothetical protein
MEKFSVDTPTGELRGINWMRVLEWIVADGLEAFKFDGGNVARERKMLSS